MDYPSFYDRVAASSMEITVVIFNSIFNWICPLIVTVSMNKKRIFHGNLVETET